mmetsp:Transcript_70350/g.183184  ORF Transcript_70350/g.183184 Transcript_70350/m.183184 type:complete len:240 (+) Transcript_70350:1223-1942(+)
MWGRGDGGDGGGGDGCRTGRRWQAADGGHPHGSRLLCAWRRRQRLRRERRQLGSRLGGGSRICGWGCRWWRRGGLRQNTPIRDVGEGGTLLGGLHRLGGVLGGPRCRHHRHRRPDAGLRAPSTQLPRVCRRIRSRCCARRACGVPAAGRAQLHRLLLLRRLHHRRRWLRWQRGLRDEGSHQRRCRRGRRRRRRGGRGNRLLARALVAKLLPLSRAGQVHVLHIGCCPTSDSNRAVRHIR